MSEPTTITIKIELTERQVKLIGDMSNLPERAQQAAEHIVYEEIAKNTEQ